MAIPGRLIAIGDIHGCSAALESILVAIDPQPQDTIVTLGDYVDRGPDTRGALELLLDLAARTRLIPLLGNHDDMMLHVCGGRQDQFAAWVLFGGNTTLDSYSTLLPEGIWHRHIEFLGACRLWFETEHHFFVHGNYDPDLPLAHQTRETLMWESLKKRVPGPHRNGKTAIVGHTAQKTGDVLDLGHLKCIDTWCYGDGWLTAMEVATGHLWQADKSGKMRSL